MVYIARRFHHENRLMARTKKIIFQSGLLLCMANLAHAAGLPADQASTTATTDSQQTNATQASDEQATRTDATTTVQAPQQTTATGITSTTTRQPVPTTVATGVPTAMGAATGQPAPTTIATGQPATMTAVPTGQAPGTAPGAPPGALAPAGTPPGTLAPVGMAPATPAPTVTTVVTPPVTTKAGVIPAMILPGTGTGTGTATATPAAVGPNGAYVPRTQFDNTPHRFNMTQDGKRMSANDFDAWMRAKGYRVVAARIPAHCTNVPPAGTKSIVGPDGCPVEVSIDLEGVTFEFGKTALRSEAKKTLDQAVEILKRHPELTVEVAGHTDSKGAPELNQKISEQRAKAVHEYLVKQGIPASRLVGPVGYGESKPIATNETDAGREQNRRTELNVKAATAPAMVAAAPAAAVPGTVSPDGEITFDVPAAAAPAPQPGAAAAAPAATAASAPQPSGAATAPAATATPVTTATTATQPQAAPAAPAAATAEPGTTSEVPATAPAARAVDGWVPRVATGKPAPAPTAEQTAQAAAARASAPAPATQPSAPPVQDAAKPEEEKTPR